MKPEHIEDILVPMHSGQWFGWSNSKNKVYENIVIHHPDKEKPTKEWLETELTRQREVYDEEQVAKQERLASAKAKLESLGLTAEEVKEAFGI